jgi:sugar lactone lactonase YvrE
MAASASVSVVAWVRPICVIVCLALAFSFSRNEVSAQVVATGFAWAENLAFSSTPEGAMMWVTDAVRGELWRITPNAPGATPKYSAELYLSKNGIAKFEGIVVDGNVVYAGATLDDDTHAIVSIPIPSTPNSFKVFAKTSRQPNGLQYDRLHGMFYYADEGGAGVPGALYGVNSTTYEEEIIKDEVDGADGLWHDAVHGKLYLGELTTKKIMIFDTTQGTPSYLGEYDGISSLNAAHMLDDFSLYSYCAADGEYPCTQLIGADFLGKAVRIFSADGQNLTEVHPPAGIKFNQVTSVHRGIGGGFDANSFFVTEGGGLSARVSDRRVVEITGI